MNYEFIDSPIIYNRIDRRSAKQKRWAQEKAQKSRDLKREVYSIEELVAEGFYDATPTLPPYGVEVWTRNCTVRDKFSNFEWEERKIHTCPAGMLRRQQSL